MRTILMVMVFVLATQAQALFYDPFYMQSNIIQVIPAYVLSEEKPFILYSGDGLTTVTVYTVEDHPIQLYSVLNGLFDPIRPDLPYSAGDPIRFVIERGDFCLTGFMPAGIEYKPGVDVTARQNYGPQILIPANSAELTSPTLQYIVNETALDFCVIVDQALTKSETVSGYIAPLDALQGNDRDRKTSYKFFDMNNQLLFETPPLSHTETGERGSIIMLPNGVYFGPPNAVLGFPAVGYYQNPSYSYAEDKTSYYVSETVPDFPFRVVVTLDGYKPVSFIVDGEIGTTWNVRVPVVSDPESGNPGPGPGDLPLVGVNLGAMIGYQLLGLAECQPLTTQADRNNDLRLDAADLVEVAPE